MTHARAKKVLDGLRLIVRELRRSAHGSAVSAAQLFVLERIGDLRVCSVNELAEQTMTDQSSVSVVVKRLVEQRLVARKPSRVDGRRVELTLTAHGKKLLARYPEPTQVRLLGALERLSAHELDGLTHGLGALVREMGIADARAPLFFEEASAQTARRRSARRARGRRA